MNEETRKLLIDLIDCIRDLNKSISMHIDNPNSESVDNADNAIMNVGIAISGKLELLTMMLQRMKK